ncbi:hypothetical protein U1Q18_038080 [Sarracenia purpurea var. burkii]
MLGGAVVLPKWPIDDGGEETTALMVLSGNVMIARLMSHQTDESPWMDSRWCGLKDAITKFEKILRLLCLYLRLQ